MSGKTPCDALPGDAFGLSVGCQAVNHTVWRLIQPFPFDMRIGRVVSHRKAKCGYHTVRFVFADEAVSLSDFRFHEFFRRITVYPLVGVSVFPHEFPGVVEYAHDVGHIGELCRSDVHFVSGMVVSCVSFLCRATGVSKCAPQSLHTYSQCVVPGGAPARILNMAAMNALKL